MLPSFRLILATFCCGFIVVFAGLRLATSINGINQAMPVMAAHAAPAMVAAISDQDLRRSPATVPVMYDLRFAVSATQPAPTPAAASPVVDRAPPLMMPLVILPPIAQAAQEAARSETPEPAETTVVAALPASPAPEPAPLAVDIPLPEPVAIDLTFSPPAKSKESPIVATVAPQATPRSTPQAAAAIDIPLPEPAAVDLTFSPPVKPASEADGRGGAGQETQKDMRHEKRSETDARAKFAANETRDPVSDIAVARPLTIAALEIPIGTVKLPINAIPLPKPKAAQRVATVHVAKAKPRRKAVRTSQRNDFDNFFGFPSGKPQ
jgi:hypothetical protein